MSRDRVFFELFGKLDKNRQTPAASIALQAAIAMVMVVSASFETLLLYIGFTLSLFAMLTVIGLMRIRRLSSTRRGFLPDIRLSADTAFVYSR